MPQYLPKWKLKVFCLFSELNSQGLSLGSAWKIYRLLINAWAFSGLMFLRLSKCWHSYNIRAVNIESEIEIYFKIMSHELRWVWLKNHQNYESEAAVPHKEGWVETNLLHSQCSSKGNFGLLHVLCIKFLCVEILCKLHLLV